MRVFVAMEDHIFSMDADGNDHKVVINGSVEDMDFDVYNNKMYWIDEASKKVIKRHSEHFNNNHSDFLSNCYNYLRIPVFYEYFNYR